mmetsp:Transcript_29237/g.83580  ORF Transcript_29237/g.83580 Transcript_29237/m.83580 type:complete len:232 (-) Transcript_29237:287-982(-)
MTSRASLTCLSRSSLDGSFMTNHFFTMLLRSPILRSAVDTQFVPVTTILRYFSWRSARICGPNLGSRPPSLCSSAPGVPPSGTSSSASSGAGKTPRIVLSARRKSRFAFSAGSSSSARGSSASGESIVTLSGWICWSCGLLRPSPMRALSVTSTDSVQASSKQPWPSDEGTASPRTKGILATAARQKAWQPKWPPERSTSASRPRVRRSAAASLFSAASVSASCAGVALPP